MQPYDMKELEERVILVGVQESFSEDVEESLDELAELCETAGALVVGRVIQNREKIHPGTYVGKGKIEEIALLMEELGATALSAMTSFLRHSLIIWRKSWTAKSWTVR